MDVEDDEEVVPIRDLTKRQSPFNRLFVYRHLILCVESTTHGSSSSKNKKLNVLQTLDPLVNSSKKMANGNYEYGSCNRHLPSSFVP